MFNTVKQLQDFIIWAKKEKIAVLKVDNVEIHMSPYAFIDDLNPSQKTTPSVTNNEEQPKTASDEEDESLLFHSAKG